MRPVVDERQIVDELLRIAAGKQFDHKALPLQEGVVRGVECGTPAFKALKEAGRWSLQG